MKLIGVLATGFFTSAVVITGTGSSHTVQGTHTHLGLVDPSELRSVSVVVETKKNTREILVYCDETVPGVLTKRKGSGNFQFTSYSKKIAKLRKKSTKSGKLKNLRKIRRLGRIACTASSEAPFPTASASPTPTATPTPGADDYFDSSGNVTELGRVEFDIPVGLSANIVDGRAVYQSNCVGCHEERTNRSFSELRTATSRVPMSYDEESLPNQNLAHLTAYLNRFRSL